MADLKYSEATQLVNTDLVGTELISLSYDSANSPGSEVWVDRVITLDELLAYLTA